MEYNMVVLDSSVLVALFDINDSQHTKAIRLFDELQSKKVRLLLYPQCIIETLTVLKNKTDKDSLQLAVVNIFDDEVFVRNSVLLQIEEKDEAIVVFLREKSISVIDAMLIFYSLQRRGKLITFDKQLIKTYEKILRDYKLD